MTKWIITILINLIETNLSAIRSKLASLADIARW